jgi:hypothetical protein
MRSMFCIPTFYVIRCFDIRVCCTVPSLSEIFLTFTVGRFRNKFDRIQFRSFEGQLKDGRTGVRLLWTVYKEQNTTKLGINIPCSLSANMTVASEHSSVPFWAVAVRVLPRIILLLFQANNAYTRDQWFHSIIWKVRTYRSYLTIYYSCSTAAAI